MLMVSLAGLETIFLAADMSGIFNAPRNRLEAAVDRDISAAVRTETEGDAVSRTALRFSNISMLTFHSAYVRADRRGSCVFMCVGERACDVDRRLSPYLIG